jgi:hypothetical protein
VDYVEAKRYLGLATEKTAHEKEREQVENFIDWQLNNWDDKKDLKLLKLYRFEDENNNTMYYKGKFIDLEGKKTLSYYSVVDGKVKNCRNTKEEYPYNLYKASKGIKEGKTLIITEGEKDADTVNYTLKNSDYVAISLKNVKDFKVIDNLKCPIVVIGDTGEAGEKYRNIIKQELFKNSTTYKNVYLTNLELLGDNKDVTDWLESGHTREDLLNTIFYHADLKSNDNLQEDNLGIYKMVWNKQTNDWDRKYITDFNIISINKIRREDGTETMETVLKSRMGHTETKNIDSKAFCDLKTFKKALGSIDYIVEANAQDLNKLQAFLREKVRNNIKYVNDIRFEQDENGELTLRTGTGSYYMDKIMLDTKVEIDKSLDIKSVQDIEKDELIKLTNNIFKFATLDKSVPIIGSTINNFFAYHNLKNNYKLHHTLIIGESGSGKSTILKNVVGAILNVKEDYIKAFGDVTAFAMLKMLSSGNYPQLFDEHKPSKWSDYTKNKLSETLRNLYDRASSSRGNKNMSVTNFPLQRPIIGAGEETYANHEKALIERSCIVYVSKNERTAEHTQHMKWLIENKELLNKFGKSIIKMVLSVSIEEYKEMQEKAFNKYVLADRPKQTACNIDVGIQIYNKLLAQMGINYQIENYEQYVEKCIKDNVLEGAESSLAIYEQILVYFDNMLQDGRVTYEKGVFIEDGDNVLIRTNEMLNQVNILLKATNSDDIQTLSIRDLKKQLTKAGYIIGSKQKRIDGRNTRFDIYDKEKLYNLDLVRLCPQFDDVEQLPTDNKIIDMF